MPGSCCSSQPLIAANAEDSSNDTISKKASAKIIPSAVTRLSTVCLMPASGSSSTSQASLSDFCSWLNTPVAPKTQGGNSYNEGHRRV